MGKHAHRRMVRTACEGVHAVGMRAQRCMAAFWQRLMPGLSCREDSGRFWGSETYGNKTCCISHRSSKKRVATVPTMIIPASARKKGEARRGLLSGPVDCVKRSIPFHTSKPTNKVIGRRAASTGTIMSNHGERLLASELCAKSQKLMCRELLLLFWGGLNRSAQHHR